MNFLILYFSIILFRNCKYISLFLSICPGSLLDLMLSLKNLDFACIKFRGPVLSQLLEYLISLRDLSKKLQSFNLCECVRVSLSAREYVYILINMTNQNSVLIATCTTQYTYLPSKCDKISKVHELKNLKVCYLYTLRKFSLALNFVTIPRRLKYCMH